MITVAWLWLFFVQINCSPSISNLIGIHIAYNAASALSFYTIPLALIHWIRQGKSSTFPKFFLLINIGLVTCGTNYLVSIWNLWYPHYLLMVVLKSFTAIILLLIVIKLLPIISEKLKSKNTQQLYLINENLDREVKQLQQIDYQLRNWNNHLEEKINQRTLELRQLNQHLTKEIWERKKIQSALHRQVQLEQLLSHLSNCFINLSVLDLEFKIDEALQIIGEFAGVERSYLILFTENQQHLKSNYSWSWDESLSPIISTSYQDLEVNLPWTWENITSKVIVNINHLNELSVLAEKDFEYLNNHQIESLLIVPVLYSRVLVGFLGFEAVSKSQIWMEKDIQLLRFTGEIIINAIERCRQQQELITRTKELENSNQELQQFASIVSHDLQEPLRSISSYSYLLEEEYRDKLDQEAQEYLKFLVQSSSRMRQMIQDLLAFSRVGSNKQNLTLVDCEIILQEVKLNLQYAIAEQDAEILQQPLPKVIADKSQLIQLWQNLLANAIKFRSEQTPQIYIGVEKTATEWIFKIKDNGIGINPQYQERIFAIFQRLHTRTSYPGTGIGLAICKRIVELHGGRIWVESSLGQGAIFYFSLPLKFS